MLGIKYLYTVSAVLLKRKNLCVVEVKSSETLQFEILQQDQFLIYTKGHWIRWLKF